MLDFVCRAAEGEPVLMPDLASKLLLEFARLNDARLDHRVETEECEPLTTGERDVLEFLVRKRRTRPLLSVP
jgi:hypothetical protein